MPIEVVFETHALTEDNERGIATGWLPGRLSERGRANAADVGRDRLDYCVNPWPGGESHEQAIARVAGLLADLPTRWSGTRVLLIGHLATYRALEHVTTGLTVRDLVADTFEWQPHGWEYRLP